VSRIQDPANRDETETMAAVTRDQVGLVLDEVAALEMAELERVEVAAIKAQRVKLTDFEDQDDPKAFNVSRRPPIGYRTAQIIPFPEPASRPRR
jgi:hypothetical protein